VSKQRRATRLAISSYDESPGSSQSPPHLPDLPTETGVHRTPRRTRLSRYKLHGKETSSACGPAIDLGDRQGSRAWFKDRHAQARECVEFPQRFSTRLILAITATISSRQSPAHISRRRTPGSPIQPAGAASSYFTLPARLLASTSSRASSPSWARSVRRHSGSRQQELRERIMAAMDFLQSRSVVQHLDLKRRQRPRR